MKRKLKNTPQFKSANVERRFWATHDSTEYLDWTTAKTTRLPALKRKTTAKPVRKVISLPVTMARYIDRAARSESKTFSDVVVAALHDYRRERVRADALDLTRRTGQSHAGVDPGIVAREIAAAVAHARKATRKPARR